MKYGQTFQAHSVPQWAPYNVDYNELKNIIKVNTTKDQGQAIAIPGHGDTQLQKFEDQFLNELHNQHDRVDLFVKSKADEILRRLEFLEKNVFQLMARSACSTSKSMSHKRREKLARYEKQIIKCGDDVKSLQRFVDAQRVAFRKILKKYRKWTGSRSLGDRFSEVLTDPKSFTRRDLEPLLTRYNDILVVIPADTPDLSQASTPSNTSRRPSVQTPVPTPPQAYWNEYDDGSEAGDDPYTLYINPGAASTFPGAKTVTFIFSKAKGPVETVKRWLSPQSSPGEQRPLLSDSNTYFPDNQATDTEADEEADASSSDMIPSSGYTTHYATFPSVSDQKLSRSREQYLFHITIGSFVVSTAMLLLSGILIATGRHRLRVEVDAGAIFGLVTSLFFAAVGLGTVLVRRDQLGWLHRACVGITFFAVCLLNGILLVLVLGNTTF